MKDRPPTEFETRVLRNIDKYGRVPTGDSLIQWRGASSRLRRLGYAQQLSGADWFITQKGKDYLKSLGTTGN